jgi:GAF domain-containing protein
LHASGGFFSADSCAALGSAPVLLEFLKSAMEVSGARAGNIQLFDSTYRTLHIAAQQGFKEDFLEYFAVVRKSDSACGAAMNTGSRVAVADVSSHPIFRGKPSCEVMLRAGAFAVQSTPLLSSAGQFLGVMSTHYHQPGNLCRRELQELDKIVQHYLTRMEEGLREATLQEEQRIRRA